MISDINIIYKLVEIVRDDLADKYDVVTIGGNNYCYRGLCDVASNKFVELFNKHYGRTSDKFIGTATIIHGELRHSPKCLSKYWYIEHTWVEIHLCMHNGMTVYVDLTGGQFNYIFDDIQEYNVSAIYPLRWYIPDRNNFRFSRLGKWMNKLIKVHTGNVQLGIIEYIQFVVFGKISDWIRTHVISH